MTIRNSQIREIEASLSKAVMISLETDGRLNGAIIARLIVKNMKNIVLLITDTFRYDNLGERARRPIRTPMLDKFEAERATAIDKFYMSSFPTVPHRTDIMTGTVGWPHYPWQPIDLSDGTSSRNS